MSTSGLLSPPSLPSSSATQPPAFNSSRAHLLRTLSVRQNSTSTFLLDSLSPSRLASLSLASSYVPSAHAPFSHLPIAAPSSVPPLPDGVSSKLDDVEKAFAKKRSKNASKSDGPNIRRRTRETEESLHRQLRQLVSAAPADLPGQWQLRFLLAGRPSPSDKLTLCRMTSAALNSRRATARQHAVRRKARLDGADIFTSAANAVRAEAALNVDLFVKHNLTSVLKEVRTVTTRRKGIAVGDVATSKIKKKYNPKAPTRMVLMGALEEYQELQDHIGAAEERKYKNLIKKMAKVENMKNTSGGRLVLGKFSSSDDGSSHSQASSDDDDDDDDDGVSLSLSTSSASLGSSKISYLLASGDEGGRVRLWPLCVAAGDVGLAGDRAPAEEEGGGGGSRRGWRRRAWSRGGHSSSSSRPTGDPSVPSPSSTTVPSAPPPPRMAGRPPSSL